MTEQGVKEYVEITLQGTDIKIWVPQIRVGGEVLGCTDRNAANYNKNATTDDGSCEYWAKPVGGA